MKTNHFIRKKKQLKNLNTQFRILVESNNPKDASILQKLALKINRLIKEIKNHISISFLKKSLGAFAFSILFSHFANAQTFSGPTQNPFSLSPTSLLAGPTSVDLDNDGDLDLVVAEAYGNIKYYQNTGTVSAPVFAAPVQNPFGIQQGYYFNFPAFCDLDNDGDFDLLTGGYYGELFYFENTGTASVPQFATAISNPFGLTSAYYFGIPNFVDLDNDGDFDLIIGEYYGNIAYYQNTGTPSSPSFAAKQLNPFGLTAVYQIAFPTSVDLDNDGDFDLMVGEYYGNLNYFENTGTANSPMFTTSQVNPFGLSQSYGLAYPCFADMDNDGDADLFVGEYYGNFQYYENTSIASTQENEFEFNISIFPNPTTNFITLQTEEKIDTYQLFDISGKEIPIVLVNNKIALDHLSPGFYTLKLINNKSKIAVTSIQKI